MFLEIIEEYISGVKMPHRFLKKVVMFKSVVADVGKRPKTVAANWVNVYNKTTM